MKKIMENYNMKKSLSLAIVFVLALSLAACDINNDAPDENSSATTTTTPDITTLTPPVATPSPTSSSELPERIDIADKPNMGNITFDELAYITFTYANVGGSSTELEILPDGTFSGQSYRELTDSNVSDNTDRRIYICNFSGRFSTPEKADDSGYVYNMNAESLTQEGMPNDEKIIDGTRYVNDEPFWFGNPNGGYGFELFLPGTPFDELPGSVIQTSGKRWNEGETPTLDYYVLYYVFDDLAFTGTIWNNSGTGKGGRWVDIDWD